MELDGVAELGGGKKVLTFKLVSAGWAALCFMKLWITVSTIISPDHDRFLRFTQSDCKLPPSFFFPPSEGITGVGELLFALLFDSSLFKVDLSTADKSVSFFPAVKPSLLREALGSFL
jgi:hypothetical protein